MDEIQVTVGGVTETVKVDPSLEGIIEGLDKVNDITNRELTKIMEETS